MAESPADAELRYRQRPGVVWRILIDGMLVLAVDQGEPIRITSPGDRIWHLLETPATLVDLVGRLGESFDVAEAVIRRDVEQLLVSMVELGLVLVEPENDA